MSDIRVRFAPSPTGSLHIGGLRTALYNYALAQKHKGKFVLRIEDTDQSRKVENGEQMIKDVLTKYGMKWDEEYRQSDRLDIYKEYAEILIENGSAFYCFTTKEELATARERAEKNGEIFHFRSPHRDLDKAEAKKRVEAGESYVVRLKTPDNLDILFEDVLQGKMKFNTNDIDDTILLKSDGFPTYHLAVVVDDHLMEISHVFRGVEWIPSIPKHVLIHRGFGWDLPQYVHLSLILDPDGGKLSKRNGSVAAEEFLSEGYLPEAILNFLMLLGWSAPLQREHGEKEREIFSLKEFAEMFDLHDLNKSSPVFNRTKLEWFNNQYISTLSPDSLENKFLVWLKEYDSKNELVQPIIDKGPDYLQEALELVRTRAKFLTEIPEAIATFYKRGDVQDFSEIKRLKKADPKTLSIVLADFIAYLKEKKEDLSDWTHDDWEENVRSIADKHGLKAGFAFMCIRIAVTDTPVSPPLYETIKILGKSETLDRISRYSQ